jgi:ribosome-associated protein YbcJ (S4-like RNA binding protein)
MPEFFNEVVIHSINSGGRAEVALFYGQVKFINRKGALKGSTLIITEFGVVYDRVVNNRSTKKLFNTV